MQTDGGVGYAVTVPAGVAERLPAAGVRVSLYTELVVKEDDWSLYGFDRAVERLVFQRLLGASGSGPSWRSRCSPRWARSARCGACWRAISRRSARSAAWAEEG